MVIQKILLTTSAVIKNNEGKILFLRCEKKSTFQGYWQLPEGKIEKNEKPEDAVKREVKEEINQNIKKIKLINKKYEQSFLKG